MPLFFLLAGAVFCNSLERKGFPCAREFVVKKTKRLLLPYIFYGVLFMIPVKYLAHWWAPNVNYFEIVRNFVINGSASGHLWFLVSLFTAYVFAYAVSKLVQGVSLWSILIVNVLCGLLCFWGMKWGSIFPHTWETVGVFKSNYLICLSLGMLLHKTRPVCEILVKRYWFVALFIAVGLFSFQMKMYNQGLRYPVLFALLVFIEVYLLSSVLFQANFIKNAFDKPWFWFVSKHLMGIYLLHDPFNYVVLYWYRRLGLFNLKVDACWVSLFRFIGLFLISLFLSWLIEKAISYFKKRITSSRFFCRLKMIEG